MNNTLKNIENSAKAVSNSFSKVNKSLTETLYGEKTIIPEHELELIYEDLKHNRESLNKWITRHQEKHTMRYKDREKIIQAHETLIKALGLIRRQLLN